MLLFVIDKLRSIKQKELGENVRNNWFIPVSALFFLLLNAGMPELISMPFSSYISILPAFILILLLSAICPPFRTFFNGTSRKIRAVAFFSSFGTCYSVWMILRYCSYPALFDYTFILRTASMILAVPFVFAVCLILWQRLAELFRTIVLSADVKKYELILYSSIFLIYCVFVTICFTSSKAFYDVSGLGEVIYTSDSPGLVRYNTFVVVDDFQNDIRQPLFAIFSAPFTGIPCMIGNLIPGVPMALVLCYSQTALLFFTTFILATELKLSVFQRMSFMLVASSTYSIMLFSVMIEQYVLSYFWLVMAICYLNREKEAGPLAMAASGSLLTNGVLVPVIYFPKTISKESVFASIKKMIFWVGDFLIALLMAGRLHVLCNAGYSFLLLSPYMGGKVSLTSRILQFFNYITGYFVIPVSEIQTVNNAPSWQLAKVTTLNFAGVAIFVLALIAFCFTRSEKLSKVAFGWILFSVLVLILVGWGTAENGLVLYSLYFGWPFFVLIFNGLKALETKLNTKLIIPVCSAVMSLVMLTFNIPGIIMMIRFAIKNYPA